MRASLAVAFAALVATTTSACSDFLVNSTAMNVMSARTMDFEADLRTVIEVIPRGTSFQELPVADCADCSDYQWQNKYGFVAFNTFGLNVATDGLNEKGLSAAWLYLEGTEYPTPQATPSNVHDPAKPVVTSVCSYLLGNYASVDEVRAGLDTFHIAEFDQRIQIQLVGNTDLGHMPLHVSVRDAQGKSLVIEFINGHAKVYDNINQVLTNDPPLDEQLAALLANGMDSIPGGYESTDRFLRVSVLNHRVTGGYSNAVDGEASYTIATAEQRGVSDALHLLNTVIRPPFLEATQWSVVRDHKRGKLYIQSTQNMVLQLVDLNQLDFSSLNNRQFIPVTYGDWAVDITAALKSPNNTAKTTDLPPRTQLEQVLEELLPGGMPPSPASTGTTRSVEHAIATASSFSFFYGVLTGAACGVVGMGLVLVLVRRRSEYARIPDARV